MTKWLLAAEADKIQDYVFRSSRLAQVVGGSSLLSRFCNEVPKIILAHHQSKFPGVETEIIKTDGGSFLIQFDDQNSTPEAGKAMADQVSHDLAEAYYRTTDGSLTVAQPYPFYEKESEFPQASEDANNSLRLRKNDRPEAVTASAQIPYTAICESCGISLAEVHAKRFERAEEEGMLLCSSCRRKATERNLLSANPESEWFLSRFHNALLSTRAWPELPEDLKERLRATDSTDITHFLPFDADDVGRYDPRNYVAYLVADGNSMGVLFSQCQTPQQMQDLSNSLSKAMWQALAEATVKLVGRLWQSGSDRCPVPVTPLIMGGDDIFALIPARYALAFARAVCLEFEQELSAIVKRGGYDFPTPTMSAVVIICKQNYPYALAHRKGEAALGATKTMSRTASLKDKVKLSAVNYEVIRGGDIEARSYEDRKYVLPTLRPYWVTADVLPPKAETYSYPLQRLLEARYELRALPGKRRAELRNLFQGALPDEERTARRSPEEAARYELATSWQEGYARFLRLIRRRPSDHKALEHALRWLGNRNEKDRNYPWQPLDGRTHEPLAHGLPDVLDVWHFAQDLAHELDEYEE